MSKTSSALAILLTLFLATACKSVVEHQDVRPRVLRDVPARNLAYRLSPDVSLPNNLINEDTADKDINVANFFAAKRQDDALLRTLASPDGKRVLALYGTENEPPSDLKTRPTKTSTSPTFSPRNGRTMRCCARSPHRTASACSRCTAPKTSRLPI